MPRNKNHFLPFPLKFLPVLSGNPNIRISSSIPYLLWFPFPIICLTWEHWPWGQWLDLLQLPSNSQCSRVKVTAHGRCKRNTGTLLSRVKTTIFEHQHHPERIKAGGSGRQKIWKQEKYIKKRLHVWSLGNHSP